jgi:hypothetical protein
LTTCPALGKGFALASLCDRATVNALLPMLPPPRLDLWVGGRQPAGSPDVLSGWAWADGTPADECDVNALWLPGEPEDSGGFEDGYEQCMTFLHRVVESFEVLGTYDGPCANQFPALCKRSPASVSVPP